MKQCERQERSDRIYFTPLTINNYCTEHLLTCRESEVNGGATLECFINKPNIYHKTLAQLYIFKYKFPSMTCMKKKMNRTKEFTDDHPKAIGDSNRERNYKTQQRLEGITGT